MQAQTEPPLRIAADLKTDGRDVSDDKPKSQPKLRKEEFETDAELPLKDVYRPPEDAVDYDRELGVPGSVSVHARRAVDDVPRPLLDDAPVRRLRQRATNRTNAITTC